MDAPTDPTAVAGSSSNSTAESSADSHPSSKQKSTAANGSAGVDAVSPTSSTDAEEDAGVSTPSTSPGASTLMDADRPSLLTAADIEPPIVSALKGGDLSAPSTQPQIPAATTSAVNQASATPPTPTAPRPPSRPPSVGRTRSRPSSSRSSSVASTSAAGARRRSSVDASQRPPVLGSRRSSVEGWQGPADVQSSPVAEGGGSSAPHPGPLQEESDLDATTPDGVVEQDVIVRDFAFRRDDPRFKGEMLPEEIELERKRRSERAMSRHSDMEGGDGTPSFSWNFVTLHSADFGSTASESSRQPHASGRRRRRRKATTDSPSQSDADGGDDFDDDGLYDDDDDDSDDLDEFGRPRTDGHGYDDSGGCNGEGSDVLGDMGEFVPGVYQALYDFEPEMDTEMRIASGEVVTVISRQCAGWVQAGRVDAGQVTGEVGLVPENYLQLLHPDTALAAEVEGIDDENGERPPDFVVPQAIESAIAEEEISPLDPLPDKSSSAKRQSLSVASVESNGVAAEEDTVVSVDANQALKP